MGSKQLLITVSLGSIVAWSCKPRADEETTSSISAAETAVPSATAAKADSSPAEQRQQMTPSVAKHMKDHFTRGSEIRNAVIAGELATAKKHAQWMAEHQLSEDLPDDWKPHVIALQDAAKQVLDATDLDAAAKYAAQMSRACGSCHAKLGGPEFKLGQAPAGGSGPGAHMQRHQWAAERMWDALTVPSEEAWQKGAELMADAPLTPEVLQGAQSVPSATTELAKEVHDLAEAARADRHPDKWQAAYGRFLATCAECHQTLHRGPSKATTAGAP